ncbi:hypothetical protein [Hydrogenophaga sp. T2]|uniref:hypothetical protein n=1 Tax=Hydrogenophaga sp. T2 TaxID=3132823 RepID=UPI003CF30D7D
MGADLRFAALSADAGLQARQAKTTPARAAVQATIVDPSWNFSIAPVSPILLRWMRVSRTERQAQTDKRSSRRHVAQARVAIGPASGKMTKRTQAGNRK